MPLIKSVFAVALLGLFAVGCQNKLTDERNALYRQNQELQRQLEGSRHAPAAPAGDAAQLKALQDQLAQRDAELASLRTQGPAPAAGTPSELEGLDVTSDPHAGTVTVNLPGDVLFPSGSADLKESAKAKLNKVVEALKKEYSGKAVRVEGHTDADPVVRSKDKWQDNLDLSLNRAAAVTRYLEDQGIEPRRIATVGYGQHKPKGGDKAASRRVEIVVIVK